MGKVPWMASVAPSKTWSTVLSRHVVINAPKKFGKFANKISNVDCLLLLKEQLLIEPEEVPKATPIPTTLKIHKVKRVKDGNSPVNKFYEEWGFGALFYSKVWCTMLTQSNGYLRRQHLQPLRSNRATRGGRGIGRESSLPFLNNRKNCPDCIHLWVKFSMQNVV